MTKSIRRIACSLAMLASVSAVGATGTMIPIDVSMAGAIPKGSSTLQLRNVKVPGFGNYKVNLTWDPEQLVFRVQSVEADTLPQFSMAATTVVITNAPNQPDYDALCAQNLGAVYRMASWEEVKAAVGTNPDNLASLVNTLSLTPSSQIVVRYGGNVKEPGSSVMYLFTLDNTRPPTVGTVNPLDSIQSRLNLFKQSPSFSGTGNLLCVKSSATAPF
jgi:hypothetical protein